MTCGDIDLRCNKCRLSKGRTRVVAGDGPCNSRLMFVGEAPGRAEDLTGVPFVGSAGRLLDVALGAAGVNRKKVFCTNIVKCRPPDNRRPRMDEVSTCTELYLSAELETVRPRIICALGQTATEYFIELKTNMSEVIGHEIPLTIEDRQVRLMPSYHPAAVLYQRKKMHDFQRSIAAAVESAGLARKG